MKKFRGNTSRYSPRAALAAVGLKINSLRLLDPVKKRVVILQKGIRRAPSQKLTGAFIAILAGARGLVEINSKVRGDEALQRAFGRTSRAGQSVVQETLNTSTALNLRQMEQALNDIFRQHGAACRHTYEEGLQLLDVDMTGMPCGPNQEGSRTGYFGENNIRYGRQLGRVIATHYEEIVVDHRLAAARARGGRGTSAASGTSRGGCSCSAVSRCSSTSRRASFTWRWTLTAPARGSRCCSPTLQSSCACCSAST